MPDKIVTTGPGAARALEAIGDYPDGMIAHDGVSLRDQINPENPAQPKHKIQKILVLLEGLTSIAPLLDVVCEAAKQNPDLAFTLRCHPQLPYDAAVSLMSSPDDGRRFLQESKHESLLAAIRWSDADIYSSSTAVFSALALGKPVIFIPTDAFYNNDALHYSQGLARTAKTPGELLAALAELDQLSDQAYSELIQKGATFCTDAMATANASAIALFETNSRQGH